MAVNRTKSVLFSKYGKKLDEAVAKHKADDTNYGVIQLPHGIQNGIAQLSKAYFDQYKSGDNEGEIYFRAVGVVLAPESINTVDGRVKVSGLQTSIMVPCCATKKASGDTVSQEENISKVLNEMRKLGGEDFTSGATGANLEDLALALEKAAPKFRFSTSPRTNQQTGEITGVWENWHGSKGLEDWEPEAKSAFSDNTGKNGTFNEFEESEGDEGETEEEVENEVEEQEEEVEEEVSETEEEEVEEEEAEEEKEDVPEVEDVYLMSLPDPKKPGKLKETEVEIQTVNPTKKTVTVKNLTTGKPVQTSEGKTRAVKWEDLKKQE